MKISSSINGLPIELLSKIFSSAIRPEDAQKDRCRLILVCRQWQECVEGSALLWTDISAQSRQTYIRRALERSKASAIDLRYSSYNTADTNLETFISEAGPHVERWRSLTVVVQHDPPSWGSALMPLTTSQAPTLESLELRCSDTDHLDPGNVITLFGGVPAPTSLKRLFLQSVPVGTLNLSGLIFLDLDAVENMSTLQLLEILRNSPCLETLSLSNITDIDSPSWAIPSVELPKLVSLTLDYLDAGAANCILSTIRIPNRRRVYICDNVRGVDVPSVLFTPTTVHILYTTDPTAGAQSSDIEVKLEGGSPCRIRFRGIELELFMHEEDQMQGILGWLAEGLGSEAAGCSIRLILDEAHVDPSRLVAVQSPLFVKHLSVPGSLFGSLLQASWATALQSAEPTSSGWLLAQMESLSIEFDTIESEEEFISVLRSRQQKQSDEAGSRSPMNLKCVELKSGPTIDGLVEEMTKIFGEFNVL